MRGPVNAKGPEMMAVVWKGGAMSVATPKPCTRMKLEGTSGSGSSSHAPVLVLKAVSGASCMCCVEGSAAYCGKPPSSNTAGWPSVPFTTISWGR